MCFIGYMPKDKSQIPNDHLRNAHHRNDDAYGFMYSYNNKLILEKGVGNHDEFHELWKKVPQRAPVIVHFRFGTSGGMGPEMAHPFPIITDEDGNVTLAMAHNGVLSCVDAEKEFSDTAVLVRDVLRPQLEENPWLLDMPGWCEAIGNLIGNPNKLTFMNGEGKVWIINDWQGKYTEGGVWYSNEYSIAPPYQVTTYKGGGGYLNDAWDKYDDYCGAGYYSDALSKYSSKGESKTGVIGAPKKDGFEKTTLVYIGGEPQYMTESELRAHFAKPGAPGVIGHSNGVRSEPLDEADDWLAKAEAEDAARKGGVIDTTAMERSDEEIDDAFNSINMGGVSAEDFVENAEFWTTTQIREWCETAPRDDMAEALICLTGYQD